MPGRGARQVHPVTGYGQVPVGRRHQHTRASHDVVVHGGPYGERRLRRQPVHEAGREGVADVRHDQNRDVEGRRQRLQQIATLIKSDAGVEVAFADIGDWDHHSNEVAQLANRVREFGTSLAAFARDLGDRLEAVVIVTMSEFGRTVKENGNAGTDHGHGNVMMVMGGSVRGGKVYGEWPGLEPEQLFEKRDLAVTTDFRDVLGELVERHLQQPVDRVFPGYRLEKHLGLLRERDVAARRV